MRPTSCSLSTPRSRRARGFTLVEAMISVAIATVIATLAATGIMYGVNRARANNATFETTAMLTLGQARAPSTGVPHFVALWQQRDPDDSTVLHSGIVLFTLPAGAAPPDWTTVDWRNARTEGLEVLEEVRLGEGNNITFVPLEEAGLGTDRLPRPFSAVPVEPTGEQGLLSACTFCVDGTARVGVLGFLTSGEVEVLTGPDLPAPPGASFALGEVRTGGERGQGPRTRLVAIAAPAGAIKVYEQ